MTISATIIADSISSTNRITTYELEYPRFIHAEFMTHRLFSRNAASSRAIPIAASIKLIEDDIAMPVHWGKNQPGMSAKEECTELVKYRSFLFFRKSYTAVAFWKFASKSAIKLAKALAAAGFHKQIVNRILEPFSHIKVVATATEFENFFWLRDHKDAQPEIAVLATTMLDALNDSTPIPLKSGSWHLPYYMNGYWIPSTYQMSLFGDDTDNIVDEFGNTLADAIAISSSCSAQTSYRKTDSSMEKALAIYDRLVGGMPPHFSPFEHQATPIEENATFETDDYITHIDRAGNAWCGNFKGWNQYRQLLMQKLNIEAMTSKPPKELL